MFGALIEHVNSEKPIRNCSAGIFDALEGSQNGR
jgi:hypothetical protein